MKQPNQTRPAPMKVLNRVLRYMLHYYALPFALVICCILIAAVATVTGSTFPQTLVDDYIVPILNSGSADFSQLAASLVRLACILAVGVLASYGYNRIMVTISQGTMRRLRDDLFHRMESLPISYFDTHAHGDIMSVYTNDIDTLRQLLSQSIPQIINTTVTMAATLVAMLVLNPALTVISVLTACVMVLVTTSFTRLSGKYYIRQQHDLGVVDGFIEEMLDGQKVVKVFCHEDAALRDFRAVNDRLRDSANMANRYSNLLMPINANIGWLSYVLVAIVGAVLGINGLAGVTLGTVISFLSLNKSFTNPITQKQTTAMWNWSTPGRTPTVRCRKHRNAPTSGPGNTPTRRTAPSPTPGWKAAWCWTMWTSATRRKNWCCTTSACGPNPARRSPL